MFCIAAFIVLAIISIFSASQRKLAKKAWNCTLHRITFRPCDTNFKEEAKSKLLSHVANRNPKMIKIADIGIEIASFLLVILTIWSLAVALESGLNLFVWGTCNPNQASSCSLTSETCSIDKVQSSFWDLTMQGKPYMWFVNKAGDLANTFANIPARLRSWDANEFLPENASYYYKKDSSKPISLEVIDPGCSVCGHLFRNIKTAGFEGKYNLAYIAYPIKNPYDAGAYKFKNSYTITKYLEAIKINELSNLKTPADWQILERIFTWKTDSGLIYQIAINNDMSKDQVVALLHTWLGNIGYSSEQISQIDKDANSQKVADIIAENGKIVEDKIKTLQIPTIIFNGQRYNGLQNVSDL